MKNYRVINGTSYDERTPDQIIRVLENARSNRTRLHISLGETDGTNIGSDWFSEFESHGYVGRSTGPLKVPLLLSNTRSRWGGPILDHCIVRIRLSVGGRVLYQHPNYHHGAMEVRLKAEPEKSPDGKVLTVDVLLEGQVHASFEDMGKARRWVNKLGVVAPITA